MVSYRIVVKDLVNPLGREIAQLVFSDGETSSNQNYTLCISKAYLRSHQTTEKNRAFFLRHVGINLLDL